MQSPIGQCASPPSDTFVRSGRLKWYCNEILRRIEGSGPISVIEFNKEGTHLAYGNSDGIVSIIEIGQADLSEITHHRHSCSKPYQVFLSHEPEFDCLKSQAIEEKISFIRWLPRSGLSHFLLSSNERTIKLWQLTELPTQSFTNLNFPVECGCRRKVVIRSLSDIKVPICLKNYENTNIRVQNKKVFARAHGFSIVGLSLSADRETFFSADPLRINMWNLEVTNEVFSVIDHMLDRLDDRSHLITGINCSNSSPSLFAYGTNRGSIFLCDTRSRSICDYPSLAFHSLAADESDVLTILTNSISDLKFGQCSDYVIFSRDYMSVKTWDSRMPTHSVEVHPVQLHLRKHLTVLYETELLFDDFKLSISSNDRCIMTGSYNNTVKIFDRYNPIEGSYKLILQDEDTNAFHDPFRATDCASSVFISSISSSSSSDSTELPWPRRLHDELIDTSDGFTNRSSFPINNNNNNVNSNESIFTVDVGRKWLQACWKPESTVAAISHSDGIHLIEAIS
ncbi:Serine/threonine-protein phosphatase 2A 55 kDa regulatory subunit B delta isoform isoform 3 [Schistosoma japonicum]|uniref:Serine/threonine-protein phosphatase 2A 55 kDa regulatory subunit B n=2 Tax=Schistosoma japonicum TaxID=6182 RepID=A0A4Z2DCZ1_SCHJA|nr:Serine/threonine-protein phosphatase 2A 55 kDa regulatory subunit B delta isoform [Schistosoma japonicum]TNN14268.1 Serine/threonine-protein phosphatase 2A 55 kDa regulatory subunit B delta isoform isoform 3 [Schistosoma japonicum]